MTEVKTAWRERFKKLKVKRMRDHHWIRVSHLRGFIQNEVAQAEARGIQKCIDVLDEEREKNHGHIYDGYYWAACHLRSLLPLQK